MKKFSNGETLVGVVLGGVIGVSLSILFAPAKGSETRKKHAAVRKQIIGFVNKKFNQVTEQIVSA